MNDESIYDHLIRISFIILGIYIGLGVGVTYNVYADDLPYFTNDTADFVLNLGSTDEIDKYTRITTRSFNDNGTLTLIIQSEIPQKMKVSLPFMGGAIKYPLQPGENTFTIDMEPRFGTYLYGIHTVNGDVFYSEKTSSLGADYALIITYHQLIKNAWKVAFISIFVLIVGLATGIYYRRRAPVRIKSRSTIMFFLLVSFGVFLLFTFNSYEKEVQIDKKITVDGVEKTIAENKIIYVYTFSSDRMGEDYRAVYFIPLIIGMLASFSLTTNTGRKIRYLQDVVTWEDDEYTQTDYGLVMDKWGDVGYIECVDSFGGDPPMSIDPHYGPIPVVTDRKIEEISPEIRKYFVMPNKASVYIFLFWAATNLLKTNLGLEIGFPMALTVMGGVFFWVNRTQIAMKLALEPMYMFIYESSPVGTMPAHFVFWAKASLEGYKEEAKRLTVMTVQAKAEGIPTTIEVLGMDAEERREVMEPTQSEDMFGDMTDEEIEALMNETMDEGEETNAD